MIEITTTHGRKLAEGYRVHMNGWDHHEFYVHNAFFCGEICDDLWVVTEGSSGRSLTDPQPSEEMAVHLAQAWLDGNKRWVVERMIERAKK